MQNLLEIFPSFALAFLIARYVARRPIEDMDAYRASLAQRLDPTAAFLQKLTK